MINKRPEITRINNTKCISGQVVTTMSNTFHEWLVITLIKQHNL